MSASGSSSPVADTTQHDDASGELTKKHPLQSAWTLWFNNPYQDIAASFQHLKTLNKVYTFVTVEDFWSVFNHIVSPSGLRNGTTYRLMRDVLDPPEWENPLCADGGELKITLPPGGPKEKARVDELWQNICLACIGEAFHFSEHVIGCNVEVRGRGTRITLWLSVSEKEITDHITEEVKQMLELDANTPPFFKSTKDILAEYAKWKK